MPQQDKHEVLPADERTDGFVRPVRQEYIHLVCQSVTRMGLAIAETYAKNPYYYGSTFCVTCDDYFLIGPKERNGQFVWAVPREDTPLGEQDYVGT